MPKKKLTMKQRNISIRAQYNSQRMSCQEIGEHWGLSTTRINQILHGLGVELRPRIWGRWGR
jgi:hypothetical protein